MKAKARAAAAACCLATLTLVASGAQAQPSRMQFCAQAWQGLKSMNQTQGKTYREFQKECLARTAPPPGMPSMEQQGGANQAAAAKGKKGGGRQAVIAAQRACGAEYKAAKADGKLPEGTTWPKYWSECAKRKKAEAM